MTVVPRWTVSLKVNLSQSSVEVVVCFKCTLVSDPSQLVLMLLVAIILPSDVLLVLRGIAAVLYQLGCYHRILLLLLLFVLGPPGLYAKQSLPFQYLLERTVHLVGRGQYNPKSFR